jgi:hypothetical protein
LLPAFGKVYEVLSGNGRRLSFNSIISFAGATLCRRRVRLRRLQPCEKGYNAEKNMDGNYLAALDLQSGA